MKYGDFWIPCQSCNYLSSNENKHLISKEIAWCFVLRVKIKIFLPLLLRSKIGSSWIPRWNVVMTGIGFVSVGHRERERIFFSQEEHKCSHNALAIHHLIRSSSNLLEMGILCGGTDEPLWSPEQHSYMLLVEFPVESSWTLGLDLVLPPISSLSLQKLHHFHEPHFPGDTLPIGVLRRKKSNLINS